MEIPHVGPHKGTTEGPGSGCVYYPPNLPSHAYSGADRGMLQARACEFEHTPGTADCLASRKTRCSPDDLVATRPLRSGACE